MNFFSNINIADALTVWDGVKDSMKTIGVRPANSTGLDFSFITPTLLALGKFPDQRIDDFSQVLHGSPVVVWNLSGKPISMPSKQKLRNQFVDAPWVTPGQFTQAPSLESIFAQCDSIKSWLDLGSDHIAVVHCSNGRSRTGILLACLLKYIGAFEHASSAFDFFCGARSQSDVKPLLAPSYRILFENVDRAVDLGCYPNRKPLHLKCIAISGVPLDEIPVVEVWDMNGIVFNSHNGWKSTNKCTWSGEYGDGFFRVSQDILGDFSVMVRFGGHHAMTRDKTTLIFKYQNSTAFLPSEVVELKRQNVDVNPEYSDCLDQEMFTVHLMLEKPSLDTASAQVATDSNTTIQRLGGSLLPLRHFSGKDAFEAGLDEISKFHCVDPEPSKCSALVDMGFPDRYSTVALQLSNNQMDSAAELLQRMKTRSTELQLSGNVVKGVGVNEKFSSGSDGLTFSASGPSASPSRALSQAVSAGDASNTGSEQTDSTVNPDKLAGEAICSVCNEDSVVNAEQLMPCRACKRNYHTTCIGARRIPFGLKTTKERQNREKYILKHYGSWRCEECVKRGAEIETTLPSTAADVIDSRGSSSNPEYRNSSKKEDPFPRQPDSEDSLSPMTKTKHEQTAIILGLLASSGMSLDHLMSLGEDKQKEALIAATALHNSRAGANPGDLARSGFDVGEDKNYDRLSSSAGGTPIRSGSDARILGSAEGTSGGNTLPIGTSTGQSSGSGSGKAFELGKNTEVGQSSGQVGSTSATGNGSGYGSGNGSSSGGIGGVGVGSGSGGSGGSGGLTAGGSVGSVGVDPRVAMQAMLARRNAAVGGDSSQSSQPEVSSGSRPSSSIVMPSGVSFVLKDDGQKLKDAPEYSKFIKMIKVGLPKSSVAQKMFSEGVVSSVLEAVEVLGMDPEGAVPVFNHRSSAEEITSNSASQNVEPTTQDADIAMMPIGQHPKYEKYFKMLKVGLPLEMVRTKMTQEGGINPDFISKDPSDLVAVDEAKHLEPAPAAKASTDQEKVPVSEHPKYSKYFRMLKVGLPKTAVKIKMESEGVDPSYLDKDPNELIPLEPEGAKVPVSEHPTYSKYFKMLKVGLPKDAIKAKMEQERVDPSYLDKDPNELIPLEESKTETKAPSPIKKEPKRRKKKLHWKALDPSKLGQDSVWADRDYTDIKLDEEEFNQLFVESSETSLAAETKTREDPKKKRINIIDMKRAQNGGISLARIKLPFPEIRNRISIMDDEAFTTDQLNSLVEFLPTYEETNLLKSYRGDVELLGQAERYMMVMLDFPSAAKRIACMLYKQQFKGRVLECKTTLSKVESACDDVKMSVRLKKVLKTILKVGNQMNDGEEHAGFSLDSLLKLQSAKAFDKKTSILQYVIVLIYRNDENCLQFPDDLANVAEASRITLDSVSSEAAQLRNGLDESCSVITSIKQDDKHSSTGTMASFLVKATQKLDDLEKSIEKVKSKFANVLEYFGEDPTMAPHEFFATLTKFIQEFVVTREKVERMRKLEAKDAAAKEAMAAGRPASRRSTADVVGGLAGSSATGDANLVAGNTDGDDAISARRVVRQTTRSVGRRSSSVV